MIYIDNDSTYSQRIYIPKDEVDPNSGITGHTFSLQRKDYDISGNGAYKIHPDAGFDGISGGTIAVYVTAATGITPEHLNVTENGIYVPTGDSVYTGVTVQVSDSAYQEGYNDGYTSGYTDGYASGQTDGYNAGYTSGHTEGYASGHTDGYQEGYASGHTDGYQEGSNSGYSSGYTDGYVSGQTDGYQDGYSSGVAAQKALLSSETFTNNGVYQRENGLNEIIVSVPQSGTTPILINHEFTENGEYRPPEGVDGWSSVTINYNETPAYNSGYTEGYASGYTSGQTDGYTSGYASGQTDGYTSGYTEGEAAQKALLGATSFTENNTYTNVNGWSAVTVNVSGGGASSLTSETFTSNGNYTPSGADGWSAITVNVPTTAGTNIQLTASTKQDFAASDNVRYNFIKGTTDTIHRLVITFPTSGTTKVRAIYDVDNDGIVKLYDSLQVNNITIDGGTPIGPTSAVTMTAGEHEVIFDCEYDDLPYASFYECTQLFEIHLEDTYATIMPYFDGCTKLTYVIMPRCEEIRIGGLKDTAVEWINAEDYPLLTTINEFAFDGCSNLQVFYPHVKEIRGGAFSGCSTLDDVETRYATVIGSLAFKGCSLDEIHIPEVASSIGSSAFAYNPATKATFVNDVERRIHYRAFVGCSNLTEFVCEASPRPPIIVDDSNVQVSTPLYNVPASGTIKVYDSSYVQDWTTWAATYLPGWTVQQG